MSLRLVLGLLNIYSRTVKNTDFVLSCLENAYNRKGIYIWNM
jgi:hypothetical protein